MVDDVPAVLDTLSATLARKLGARVLTAASGEDALDVPQRAPVDLVISDQRKGAMDGTEFLARCGAGPMLLARVCESARAIRGVVGRA